jgi:excisionase family DNA binding protein
MIQKAEVIQLPPLLLSRQDAARALGISMTEIDRLLSTGELRGKQYGRRRLILFESIQQYVEGMPDA